jgi:glycosyltransferase involved in cell wall biosynthesis
MRVAVTVEQSWHVVPGGIATSTIAMLRALARRGDLDLVGISARHRAPPLPGFIPPVPVRRSRLPRRALYESWQWFRRPLVERVTGHVNVVHDAGYVVPPTRAPLVATIHDLLFLRFPDHYTWHSREVLRRGLDLARRDATLVICPSRATIAACEEAGINADRLRLVPWGVEVRTLNASEAAAVRKRYGIERPYLLFCGTREPRKNLPRLLEAVRRLDNRDVELVLAGPAGWKGDVTDGSDGVGGRVRTLGFVPPEELGALYEGAELVVYPSLAEGFGLPVLEAMAHGAPVVTSAGSATEEVAGEAALLVDPLDTDAIASAIDRILDDSALAMSLREAARARATTFTWDRTADRVAAVYAEAARSGR